MVDRTKQIEALRQVAEEQLQAFGFKQKHEGSRWWWYTLKDEARDISTSVNVDISDTYSRYSYSYSGANGISIKVQCHHDKATSGSYKKPESVLKNLPRRLNEAVERCNRIHINSQERHDGIVDRGNRVMEKWQALNLPYPVEISETKLKVPVGGRLLHVHLDNNTDELFTYVSIGQYRDQVERVELNKALKIIEILEN